MVTARVQDGTTWKHMAPSKGCSECQHPSPSLAFWQTPRQAGGFYSGKKVQCYFFVVFFSNIFTDFREERGGRESVTINDERITDWLPAVTPGMCPIRNQPGSLGSWMDPQPLSRHQLCPDWRLLAWGKAGGGLCSCVLPESPTGLSL